MIKTVFLDMDEVSSMRHINKNVGVGDKYGKGKVAFIDFTYLDILFVWVTYKTVTKAFLYTGG